MSVHPSSFSHVFLPYLFSRFPPHVAPPLLMSWQAQALVRLAAECLPGSQALLRAVCIAACVWAMQPCALDPYLPHLQFLLNYLLPLEHLFSTLFECHYLAFLERASLFSYS